MTKHLWERQVHVKDMMKKTPTFCTLPQGLKEIAGVRRRTLRVVTSQSLTSMPCPFLLLISYDNPGFRGSWIQMVLSARLLRWILGIIGCLGGRGSKSSHTPTVEDGRILPNREEIQIERSRRLFLDKLDLCSESDIIDTCQSLNDKIRSTALTIFDDWSKSGSCWSGQTCAPTPLSEDDESYLRNAMGIKLFMQIKRSRIPLPSEERESRVGDALQTVLVFICLDIISHTLVPGLSDETNRDLQEIFNKMLLKGTSLR